MTKITLRVNNEEKQLKSTCALSQALVQWNYVKANVAIAINDEFIPRSHYTKRILQANDCIDIVAPIQGG